MTDDIVRRLEAWARDTEQSWSDVLTPTPDQPGHEWYVADAAEVLMAREAAGVISRLSGELRTLSDRSLIAEAGLREATIELLILRERDEAAQARHDSMANTIARMTLELGDVTAERGQAVAALSEQLDKVRAERDEMQRMVCRALYTDPLMQRNHAKVCGWRCFNVTERRQPDATTDKTSQEAT